MWLTKPNGEHFIISVLWVVSEGVWFRKWTTAQKEKVCSHEAVGIESANSGLSSLRMSDKPYVAAAKVIPPCGRAHTYIHSPNLHRQTDGQTHDMSQQSLSTEERGVT